MGPPPVRPVKKSSTGLILGLAGGALVLMLLAGAAVWFFLLGGKPPGGQAEGPKYPQSYDRTVDPAADGQTFDEGTIPASTCDLVDAARFEKVMPVKTSTPSGSLLNDSRAKYCTIDLDNEAQYGKLGQSGVVEIGFLAYEDATEAAAIFGESKEGQVATGGEPLTIEGLESDHWAVSYGGKNDGTNEEYYRSVQVNALNGNLRVGVQFKLEDTYDEVDGDGGAVAPDVPFEVMWGMCVDAMNEAMAKLAKT